MAFEGFEFEGNDRFRVIRRLGAGGMGVVYEAEDRSDGRRLAIKVIRHGNSEEIYRLKREFRALADLSHPNLVDVYDLGGEGHALFVTMELVEGETFTRYCRGDRAVGELGDERRIRAALPQLVRALAALHEGSMVHRDVKPSNVLVTEEGRVVLLDLGLVATQTQSDSLAGRIVGSVEYMAPEQANAETVGPAADWYAVGALLFEALTGKPPFSGSIVECLMAKQQHPAPPPGAVVPTVAEDLDDLCTALLARDVDRRPSLAQILVRLGAAPRDARTPTSSLSLTQLVPFRGRVTELGRLRAAADQVRAGGNAVVYVRGASGIGKSALIDRFVEESMRTDPPFLALRGRCYEREAVPYKAMDAVVDELSRYWTQLPTEEAAALLPPQASLLPRLFPVLGRVPVVNTAGRGEWVSDPQEMRTRAFEALRHVFIEIARRQPVVMVLDDLQWIDDDSVILLVDLLRAPHPAGVLLLLASRDEFARSRRAQTESELGRPEEPPALEHLLRDLPPHELIEVGPLPPAEARKLAASMLGEGLAEHVDAVVQEAAGSPFFLYELSRYLQDSPDHERVSIDDVLRARMARLPERGAAVIELLSIAGNPVSPRVIQSALGFAPEEVARLVRYLRASFMVRVPGGGNDAVEPYHDRVREHARSAITPERRQHLHRDLAMALERWSEGGAEQRARHWFAAGDRERATRYAREAGDEAAGTMDFARAARLYRLALSADAMDSTERRQVTAMLGIALSNAGRAAEGAERLLEAAVGADPATALELRQRSAEALLLGGYFREGMAALGEVLDQLGLRLARTPRTALLSLLRLRAWLRLRGLGWKQRDASELPKTVLTEIDARYTVASTLSVVDNIRAAEFQARHLLAALRGGEPYRVSRALGVEAGFLGTLGVPARALRLADLSDEVGERVATDAVPAPPFAGWARGAVEYFANNDWDLSRQHFELTEHKVRSYGRSGWELSTAQLYRAFALFYAGRIGELVVSVPRYLRESERRGDLYSTTNLRARLNIVWLAADDPERAEHELESAMSQWVPEGPVFHVQHWFGLVGRVELALYRGQAEVAAARLAETAPALRRSLLVRVPMVRAELAYLEGRVAVARLAAGGDERRDLRQIRRAGAALRRSRSRLPFARQLSALLLATTAVARRDPDADALLDAAHAALEAGRTVLFAQVVRRLIGVRRGDAELVDAVDTWMASEQVRNPAAMTRLLLGIDPALEPEGGR